MARRPGPGSGFLGLTASNRTARAAAVTVEVPEDIAKRVNKRRVYPASVYFSFQALESELGGWFHNLPVGTIATSAANAALQMAHQKVLPAWTAQHAMGESDAHELPSLAAHDVHVICRKAVYGSASAHYAIYTLELRIPAVWKQPFTDYLMSTDAAMLLNVPEVGLIPAQLQRTRDPRSSVYMVQVRRAEVRDGLFGRVCMIDGIEPADGNRN